jgi:hypothetical protein
MTTSIKSTRLELRALGGLLLMLVSAAATAQVWLETSKNDKYIAYASPSSVKREGNMVTMWSLFDYKTPQTDAAGRQFLSAKRHFDYDCTEQRVRPLAESLFAMPEAKGQPYSTISVKYEWKKVAPETADEFLLRFACKKN